MKQLIIVTTCIAALNCFLATVRNADLLFGLSQNLSQFLSSFLLLYCLIHALTQRSHSTSNNKKLGIQGVLYFIAIPLVYDLLQFFYNHFTHNEFRPDPNWYKLLSMALWVIAIFQISAISCFRRSIESRWALFFFSETVSVVSLAYNYKILYL